MSCVMLIHYFDFKGIHHQEKIHFVLPTVRNGNKFLTSHAAVLQHYHCESSDRPGFD